MEDERQTQTQIKTLVAVRIDEGKVKTIHQLLLLLVILGCLGGLIGGIGAVQFALCRSKTPGISFRDCIRNIPLGKD